MSMVESIPARNRMYVRDKLMATYRRLAEDGVISGRELPELFEVMDGTLRFSNAIAAIHMVDAANGRSCDDRRLIDLVAIRQSTVAALPDAS